MIKILALAPYKFLPAENGGQKAIEGLYTALSKRTELTCASTANNDLAKDHGFELLPIFSNSKLRYADIFSVVSLSKFIRKRRIQHLLIEHPYMGLLALRIRKNTGVKLIVHSHNIEGLRFKSMHKWWAPLLASYERNIHRKADLSLFITEEDRDFALREFGLEPKKTMTVPFAVHLSQAPDKKEKQETKRILCERHNISSDTNLLIYAGAFDYAPNAEGLAALLDHVIPELKRMHFKFHLLICGKNIPAALIKNDSDITYTGFVENIYEYYKGSDIFLNPVIGGGGIKTKLAEALGNNCAAVSTMNGAIGIPANITGSQLMRVADGDWKQFALEITEIKNEANIPSAYLDYFNGDKIADRIVERLKSLS